jgi:hypothetical protein
MNASAYEAARERNSRERTPQDPQQVEQARKSLAPKPRDPAHDGHSHQNMVHKPKDPHRHTKSKSEPVAEQPTAKPEMSINPRNGGDLPFLNGRREWSYELMKYEDGRAG